MHGNHGAKQVARGAGWEASDTADLAVCATSERYVIGSLLSGGAVGRGSFSYVGQLVTCAAALADAEVMKFLGGKEPKNKIYVKGRLVNLVV